MVRIHQAPQAIEDVWSIDRYIIVAKVIYQRSIFEISLCTSQHLVMSKGYM